MSPLERLIGAIVRLDGDDALMPLSVLLPLYRHRLDEPALKLIELYDQDEQQFIDVVKALHAPENMYWFDVSMHHNEQDLLNMTMLFVLDRATQQDPCAKKLQQMATLVRARTKSEHPFLFIRVLHVAARDKTLALQSLPRLEPYLDEVVAMVEQGYPTVLQLP